MGLGDEFDTEYTIDAEETGSGYEERFDPGVEGIRQAYEVWGSPKVAEADFGKLEETVAGVEYDADDIYEFCREEELEYASDGWFVSALINRVDEEEIVLPDMTGVECLGKENMKMITVEGDVGRWVGNCMKDGTIVVEGDAGREFTPGIVSRAGENMEGGEIYVHGYAESGKREGGEVYRRNEDGEFEPLEWEGT